MDEGFSRGQSDNLPKVDSFMVARYLSENSDFVAAEMRGMKLQKSGRESYGDEAIGYVQLKREGDICTVKCRITPEHRVRVKPYHCTLICNEIAGQIISVACEDCAASKGGCKHAVAFLMWLHRRTEEPATTSVKCYWKKSTLAGVGTSLKFIKAKDFGSQQPQNKEESNNFFDKVKVKLRETKTECQMAAYVNDTLEMQKLSMHYIICTFLKEATDRNFQNFMAFSKTIYTKERCDMVQNATVAQSDSMLWYEMRYGRITASKAHEAAHCRSEDGSLVEQIFGAKSLIKTKAVERGKILEEPVRKEVARLKNITVKQSGLVLSSDWPFFGASPDGISEDYVLEIKCPSKSSTLPSYFNDGNIGKKYYAQIQSQMHVVKKVKGLFCIAQPDFEVSNKVEIHEVAYDKAYCDELFLKITKFWEECIFKKFINVNHE